MDSKLKARAVRENERGRNHEGEEGREGGKPGGREKRISQGPNEIDEAIFNVYGYYCITRQRAAHYQKTYSWLRPVCRRVITGPLRLYCGGGGHVSKLLLLFG